MKPVGRRMTVDFYRAADPPPQVGQVVRELRADGTVRGLGRILSVRQVVVRVSRGETARYALRLQRLDAIPPEGVAFTITAYPRTPRLPKCSPLLD